MMPPSKPRAPAEERVMPAGEFGLDGRPELYWSCLSRCFWQRRQRRPRFELDWRVSGGGDGRVARLRLLPAQPSTRRKQCKTMMTMPPLISRFDGIATDMLAAHGRLPPKRRLAYH